LIKLSVFIAISLTFSFDTESTLELLFLLLVGTKSSSGLGERFVVVVTGGELSESFSFSLLRLLLFVKSVIDRLMKLKPDAVAAVEVAESSEFPFTRELAASV
jgi:hypothetical protein